VIETAPARTMGASGVLLQSGMHSSSLRTALQQQHRPSTALLAHSPPQQQMQMPWRSQARRLVLCSDSSLAAGMPSPDAGGGGGGGGASSSGRPSPVPGGGGKAKGKKSGPEALGELLNLAERSVRVRLMQLCSLCVYVL